MARLAVSLCLLLLAGAALASEEGGRQGLLAWFLALPSPQSGRLHCHRAITWQGFALGAPLMRAAPPTSDGSAHV